MHTTYINLPALTYDRMVWTDGSRAEKKQADQQYKELLHFWKKLVADKKLLAVKFLDNHNNNLLLTRSLYYLESWQLTTLDERGAETKVLSREGWDTYATSTLVRQLSLLATRGQPIIVTMAE